MPGRADGSRLLGRSRRILFEAGLLKEVGLPRVEANTRTALVEDPNFGDSLPALRPRMEEALAALTGPQQELIAVIKSGETDPQRLAALRRRARGRE